MIYSNNVYLAKFDRIAFRQYNIEIHFGTYIKVTFKFFGSIDLFNASKALNPSLIL